MDNKGYHIYYFLTKTHYGPSTFACLVHGADLPHARALNFAVRKNMEPSLRKMGGGSSKPFHVDAFGRHFGRLFN